MKSHNSVTHHPERVIELAVHTCVRRQSGAHGHPLHHLYRVLASKTGEIIHGIGVQFLRRVLNQIHELAVPLSRDSSAVRAGQLVRKASSTKNDDTKIARKAANSAPHGFTHL